MPGVRAAFGMLAERWLAIALASLSAVLLYSAVNGERGLRHVFRLEAELAEATERNFRRVQEISALRRQVRAIREDDAYLERVARRRLSFARQDEILYRVLPDRGSAGMDDDAGRKEDPPRDPPPGR